jgi:hypothetical protein
VGKVSKAPKKKKKGLGAKVGSVTYLLEFGKVLHNTSKTRR